MAFDEVLAEGSNDLLYLDSSLFVDFGIPYDGLSLVLSEFKQYLWLGFRHSAFNRLLSEILNLPQTFAIINFVGMLRSYFRVHIFKSVFVEFGIIW